MIIGKGRETGCLSETEVRNLLAEGLASIPITGKRVLVIIPDRTRTAPIPLFFRLLYEMLGQEVAALDYLVALGTHPPMSEDALNRLVGLTPDERSGTYGRVGIYNHRWDLPSTLVQVGMIPAAEVYRITNGLMGQDIPVALNRLILAYDQLIICGPTFPHEVVGFSGGNKYFFPGIAGPDVINATHWLGALLTSMAIIGTKDTPVRQLIDQAASFIPIPTLCLSLVVKEKASSTTGLAGLYIGPPKEAYAAAADLSERLHIIYLERPFPQVLSIMPTMYDDLWTAAKGMYKLEPVVADGGELIIYAPHITEVSYTHGEILDQIGYHVRDYFVKQMDRFRHIPGGVMAHSTHLKGAGTFEDGVEHPRIQVTLATGIPEERCRRLNLGYRDPRSIRIAEWEGREAEGILVVHKAGEILYRLRKT